jgi:uncharacterized protein YndB with AHSA1/START domain
MAPMTTSQSAVVTLPTDTQILVTREFAAPRHLVWRAYTEPELIAKWWHANRGEIQSVDVDLRVGGTWRWVMVTPDGYEVAFNGEYREIVPNERLVYTELFEGVPTDPADAAVNTMTLTEVDGRTTMVALTELRTQEARDAILATGMEAGMQDAYDLLEDVAISLA